MRRVVQRSWRSFVSYALCLPFPAPLYSKHGIPVIRASESLRYPSLPDLSSSLSLCLSLLSSLFGGLFLTPSLSLRIK